MLSKEQIHSIIKSPRAYRYPGPELTYYIFIKSRFSSGYIRFRWMRPEWVGMSRYTFMQTDNFEYYTVWAVHSTRFTNN